MGRAPKYDDDVILDRAMRVFWEGGYSQTSIRDLERSLDLKAPSIYRRFGSKEQLGAAVVGHYVERVVRVRVDRYLSGEGHPVVNIATFLERSVTQPDVGRPLRGCLLTTTALEAEPLGSDLSRALARGLAEIEGGFRREVLRAAELGHLATGVEPESAVATLTLVMQGLMALARGGADPATLQEQARAAVSMIAAERAITTQPGTTP